MRRVLLPLLIIGLLVLCSSVATADDSGSSSTDNDTSSTDNDTSSTDNDTSSTDNDTSSTDNDTPSTDNDNLSNENDNTSTVNDNSSTGGEAILPVSNVSSSNNPQQNLNSSVQIPTVSISAEPISDSLIVRFTRSVTNNPDTYLWDFGDGNTSDSISETVSYTYSRADTYSVYLTVNNSAGSSSATTTVTVSGSTDVSIETNVSSGNAPLSVNFTAVTELLVTDSTGFRWEVHPDATYKYGKTVNYTYEEEGTYTVSLRVIPDSGSTIERTVTITVGESSASTALSAGFTPSVTTATIPFTVTFSDTSTGDISRWDWTIGSDTKTYTVKTDPTYRFSVAGNYVVKLVVTGTNNETSEKSMTIIAAPVSTPTATVAAAKAATVEPVATSEELIPNPLNLLDELIKLILTMLNPANYSMNL